MLCNKEAPIVAFILFIFFLCCIQGERKEEWKRKRVRIISEMLEDERRHVEASWRPNESTNRSLLIDTRFAFRPFSIHPKHSFHINLFCDFEFSNIFWHLLSLEGTAHIAFPLFVSLTPNYLYFVWRFVRCHFHTMFWLYETKCHFIFANRIKCFICLPPSPPTLLSNRYHISSYIPSKLQYFCTILLQKSGRLMLFKCAMHDFMLTLSGASWNLCGGFSAGTSFTANRKLAISAEKYRNTSGIRSSDPLQKIRVDLWPILLLFERDVHTELEIQWYPKGFIQWFLFSNALDLLLRSEDIS